MKIGELAKRSGLAASRIRFYEAAGLLETVQRQANGYREYPPQALRQLDLIRSAQQAGFSLEEIRQLQPPVGAIEGDHTRLLDGLKRKVAEIEQLQERLAQNRKQLLAFIDGIENKPEGMGCEANAERLLAGIRERTAQG